MWLAILFAIWLGYGALQWRKGRSLLARMRGLSPAKRKLFGSSLLVGSAAILLGGLFAISTMGGTRLAWWQYGAISLLGLAFIHAQIMAAAMLASLGDFRVTEGHGRASETRTTEI